MLTALLAGIAGFRSYLMIGAALVAAAIVGVLALQLHSAHAELDAKKLDIERLTQAEIAQKLVIDGQHDAIAELDATNKELEQQSGELAATLEEIRHAKPEDNGPIAPVLERTLRRVSPDGLRERPKPRAAKDGVRQRANPGKPARLP